MKYLSYLARYFSLVLFGSAEEAASDSIDSDPQDHIKPLFLYSINPNIAAGISIFVTSLLTSAIVLLESGTYYPPSAVMRAVLNFALIGLITSGVVLSIGPHRWPVRKASFYDHCFTVYGWKGHRIVNIKEIESVERFTRSFGIWPRTTVTYVELFIKGERLPISIPNCRSKKLGVDLYSWLRSPIENRTQRGK
jgi:hypothetical protein